MTTQNTGNGEETSQFQALTGDRSGHRLWAADADFFLAALVSMLAVILSPPFDPLLKGLSFYLLYLLYFQLTEYYWGTTPAKWWFGLCVRDDSGQRATARQIAIRTLFRVIEVNPMFFGFFPAAAIAMMTKRGVRLGDIVAHTVVTRVEYVSIHSSNLNH